MFDVGFWEILLIGVLALVVIGPERLPGAARKAGYFVGKARRYVEGVKSEVASELDVNEFKRMMHNQEVQINELQQKLKSSIDDVKSELPSTDFLKSSSSESIYDEADAESGDVSEVGISEIDSSRVDSAKNEIEQLPDTESSTFSQKENQ
jgi:sec-independent protein translocase protein TatB